MDILIVPLLILLKSIFSLLVFVVVVDVVIGWLIAGGIINTSSIIVYYIANTVSTISEWMLAPIRRHIPVTVGTLDISPVVLMLLLTFAENVITRILMRFV